MPSNYKKFWDPRIGVAWQPKGMGDTSVRAAIGMFAVPMDYANFNHASDLAPFSPTYQFQWRHDCEWQSDSDHSFLQSVVGLLTPEWPEPFPAVFQSRHSSEIERRNHDADQYSGRFQSKLYTAGRTYTWNLSVEHLFGARWLAKAAYVGSESDHQSLAVDENYGQFFGTGNPANGTRLNPNFGQPP